MLQNFKQILGSAIHAQDGKIGHLDDLLFDDESWAVRYLVIKTGGLLTRKRVLISPLGVAETDWEKSELKLNMTREKIEQSPNSDTEEPVFRQMEKKYFDYYQWPYYWDDVGIWGVNARKLIDRDDIEKQDENKKTRDESKVDPHLRSCRIITKYAVEAGGERFGHLDDLIIDDHTWSLQSVIVDANTWWPDKPVILSTKLVKSVDWLSQSVILSITRRELETSPEFNSRDLLSPP
ncbi:MAG: hypothetical protein ACXVAX_10595 [Pseudobdellovibrio sp.]